MCCEAHSPSRPLYPRNPNGSDAAFMRQDFESNGPGFALERSTSAGLQRDAILSFNAVVSSIGCSGVVIRCCN